MVCRSNENRERRWKCEVEEFMDWLDAAFSYGLSMFLGKAEPAEPPIILRPDTMRPVDSLADLYGRCVTNKNPFYRIAVGCFVRDLRIEHLRPATPFIENWQADWNAIEAYTIRAAKDNETPYEVSETAIIAVFNRLAGVCNYPISRQDNSTGGSAKPHREEPFD